MKCRKPNTDQCAEFTLLVNGVERSEHTVPSPCATDENTLECCVPVADGDTVSVRGYFEGSVLHAFFDVLVDGSFVAHKRIEGLKTGRVRFMKRNVKFTKFFDLWQPKDGPDTLPLTNFVQGKLCVRALPRERPELLNGHELGLGSLAVVISISQNEGDVYISNYPDRTIGSWRDRDNGRAVRIAGIQPTSQVELVESDVQLTNNGQSKQRRHQEQNRCGKKPWATFVFYYRSHAALSQASHPILSDGAQMLEPGSPTNFIKGDYLAMTKRKRVDTDEDEEDGSTMDEQRRRKVDPTKPMTDCDGRCDGVGTEKRGTLFVTPPPVEQRYKASSSQRSLSESGFDNSASIYVDRNIVNKSGDTSECNTTGEQFIEAGEDNLNIARPQNSAEVDDFAEQSSSAQALLNKLKMTNASLTEANTPELEMSMVETKKVAPLLLPEPKNKDEQKAHDMQHDEKMPFETLSPDEIVNAIPQHGIPIEDLYKRFSSYNIPVTMLLRKVEELADWREGRYFLRAATPPILKQKSNASHQYREGEIGTKNKMSSERFEMSSSTLPLQPFSSRSAFSAPASTPPAVLLTTGFFGNLYEIASRTRELDELRAKKATLKLDLERKHRRKQALQEQLEIERRRQESEEQKRIDEEKREIEKLERMHQELDSEMQVLDQLANGFDGQRVDGSEMRCDEL